MHQKEFVLLGAVECFRRQDRAVLEARRFGRGVCVKRSVLDHLSIAGPKSHTDHFVGVAFLHDHVGIRPLWRASAGKPRRRQIKAAPKEMYRAGFANKLCSKLLENWRHGGECLPKSMRVFGVVRGMKLIEFEANWSWNFHGHVPDLHVDAERVQSGHELRVKLGDRAWRQAKGSALSEA